MTGMLRFISQQRGSEVPSRCCTSASLPDAPMSVICNNESALQSDAPSPQLFTLYSDEPVVGGRISCSSQSSVVSQQFCSEPDSIVVPRLKAPQRLLPTTNSFVILFPQKSSTTITNCRQASVMTKKLQGDRISYESILLQEEVSSNTLCLSPLGETKELVDFDGSPDSSFQSFRSHNDIQSFSPAKSIPSDSLLPGSGAKQRQIIIEPHVGHDYNRPKLQHPNEIASLFDSPLPDDPRLSWNTEAPTMKRKSENPIEKILKDQSSLKKSPRLKYQKGTDIRVRRPRLRPSLKRWSPHNPEGPKLLRPWPTPVWVRKLQQKLPWYSEYIDSGGGPWLSLRSWDAPYEWFWKEVYMRWTQYGDRWLFCLRLFGVSLTIFVFILMNVATLGDFYGSIKGVSEPWDWFHDITRPINVYITNNDAAYSGLMFVAGLLMDSLLLWLLFQWFLLCPLNFFILQAILGDSTRLPIALLLLYSLRGFQRAYCLLPFPEGYIWKAPKFGSISWPSLVVPYQPSDDFFYSGHIGCGTLAASEHYYIRNWWGVCFSIFVTLFQTFWMCCTRGHYMIDMFTGAVVASWAHMIAQSISRPVDMYLALPPRPFVKLRVSVPRSRSVVSKVPTSILEGGTKDVKVESSEAQKSFGPVDHTIVIGTQLSICGVDPTSVEREERNQSVRLEVCNSIPSSDLNK